MRVVNLARRPFVNRRPIVRFAVLVWLAGILLLVWNVRLYRGHWQGTAENRALREEAELQLEAERRRLAQEERRLNAIDLREQNRKAAFLNSLIAYRTFPWSPFFDDLEEVLPADVKLFNVSPDVRLATELARESRRAELRRAAAERAAASQRSRSARRRRAAEQDRTAEDAVEPTATSDGQTPSPEEPQLASDEVLLRFNGLAKSEDALVEFVDRLFENPSFRRPVLDSEVFDPNQRATSFSLFVVYLTHRPAAVEPAPPQVAEESPPEAGSPSGVPGDAGGPGELAAGGARFGVPVEATTETEAAAPETGRAVDVAVRGAPERGALGAPGPTQERGGPEPLVPDHETPQRGASAPAPGQPRPTGFQTVGGVPVVPPPPGAATGPAGRGAPEGGTPGGAGRGTPESGAPEREAPAPEGETAGRVPPDREPEDRPTGRDREEARPAGDTAEDETGLGGRDASATPAIDRGGGQVQLVPGFPGAPSPAALPAEATA